MPTTDELQRQAKRAQDQAAEADRLAKEAKDRAAQALQVEMATEQQRIKKEQEFSAQKTKELQGKIDQLK